MEITYGGTAPVVTQFWPPIIPPCPEAQDDTNVDIIHKKQYYEFLKKNPGLTKMP